MNEYLQALVVSAWLAIVPGMLHANSVDGMEPFVLHGSVREEGEEAHQESPQKPDVRSVWRCVDPQAAGVRNMGGEVLQSGVQKRASTFLSNLRQATKGTTSRVVQQEVSSASRQRPLRGMPEDVQHSNASPAKIFLQHEVSCSAMEPHQADARTSRKGWC